MKETNETKKPYETPSCEVMEVELQGVIAASGGPVAPPSWTPIDA